MKKLWKDMSTDEQRRFMRALDREVDSSDRKWRLHYVNIGTTNDLEKLYESGSKLPEYHGGDRILERFWRGGEPYEG